MKIGDKARVINGKFKDVEGVIIDSVKWESTNIVNGKLIDKKTEIQVALMIDNFNTIKVMLDDIEIIDEIEKGFCYIDAYNLIAIRSNLKDWNESAEGYKRNENSDVIFVETVNYNQDDEENVHMFTSLSVPQAKFLIEKLSEVVKYIEKESKRSDNK
jgi:hypothetical protein